MPRWLPLTFALFGTVVILIALAHLIAGPAAIFGSEPVNATMDSQDRFYAAIFLAYGCALWWCSRDIHSHAGKLHVLLLVFFLGGAARVISIYVVGWPSAFYIALTGFDLILPLVLAALLSKAVRSNDGPLRAGSAAPEEPAPPVG